MIKKCLLAALAPAFAFAAVPAAAEELEPEYSMACSGYQFLMHNLLKDSDADAASERMLWAQRWFAYYIKQTGLNDDKALANISEVVTGFAGLYEGTEAERDTLAETGSACVQLQGIMDEELKTAKIKRDLTR